MIMFQFGHRAGLTFKTSGSLFPLRGLWYRPQVTTDNFNGYFASNACVLGQINITHATTFDELLQAIPTEGFPHQHIHLIGPLSKKSCYNLGEASFLYFKL